MARKTIKDLTMVRAFSKLIRERDNYICQYPSCKHCGNYDLRYVTDPFERAECSHYRPCRYLAGRFHPDNCLTLCHKVHAEIDQGPQALHVRLMIQILGESAHDDLVARLQRNFKYPQWERIEMHEHYKAQLKYLERLRKEGHEGVLTVVSFDQ